MHSEPLDLAICNDVDGLEGIVLSEISQSERQTYDFSRVWDLRNKTDERRERKGEIKRDGNREGGKAQRLLIMGNKVQLLERRWVGDGNRGPA